MAVFTTKIWIDRPSEHVFDVYARVEDWPLWTRSVHEVQRLDPGPMRRGARARVKQPRLPTTEWTVTEYLPGQSFTWQSTTTGSMSIGRHIIQEQRGGSMVIAGARATRTARSTPACCTGPPVPPLPAHGGGRTQDLLREPFTTGRVRSPPGVSQAHTKTRGPRHDPWNRRLKESTVNRVGRWLLHAPCHLYDWHLGWLLGHRFLRVTHLGRRSNLIRQTMLEVFGRTEDGSLVVLSARGDHAAWVKNVKACSAVRIAIGGDRFAADAVVLDADRALRALVDYERRHRRLIAVVRKVLSRLIGWDYDGSSAARRRLAQERRLIAFHRSAVPTRTERGASAWVPPAASKQGWRPRQVVWQP